MIYALRERESRGRTREPARAGVLIRVCERSEFSLLASSMSKPRPKPTWTNCGHKCCVTSGESTRGGGGVPTALCVASKNRSHQERMVACVDGCKPNGQTAWRCLDGCMTKFARMIPTRLEDAKSMTPEYVNAPAIDSTIATDWETLAKGGTPHERSGLLARTDGHLQFKAGYCPFCYDLIFEQPPPCMEPGFAALDPNLLDEGIHDYDDCILMSDQDGTLEKRPVRLVVITAHGVTRAGDTDGIQFRDVGTDEHDNYAHIWRKVEPHPVARRAGARRGSGLGAQGLARGGSGRFWARRWSEQRGGRRGVTGQGAPGPSAAAQPARARRAPARPPPARRR